MNIDIPSELETIRLSFDLIVEDELYTFWVDHLIEDGEYDVDIEAGWDEKTTAMLREYADDITPLHTPITASYILEKLDKPEELKGYINEVYGETEMEVRVIPNDRVEGLLQTYGFEGDMEWSTADNLIALKIAAAFAPYCKVYQQVKWPR